MFFVVIVVWIIRVVHSYCTYVAKAGLKQALAKKEISIGKNVFTRATTENKITTSSIPSVPKYKAF